MLELIGRAAAFPPRARLRIVLGVVLVAGGVLFVVILLAWIRDARREFEHLPSEHHH